MQREDPQSRLKEAYHQLFQGHSQQAEVLFRALAAQYPQHPDVWNGLGLLAEQQGQGEQALKHYQTALDLNASEPEYHNNLALLLQSRGEDAAALAHFEALYQLLPDYRSAFNLSQAYQRLGAGSKALELAQTAIWQAPEAVFLHQYLYELYQSQGAQQAGLVWYQQLLRKHTQSGPAAYFLACLYESVGELEHARVYLNTTLQLMPDWRLPRRQLIIWNLKNNHALALKHSRLLYHSDPSPEHLLLLINTLPAPVYVSREAQFENLAEVEKLLDKALEEVWEVPDFRLISLPFHLAYQNGNDRLWNEKFHRLYRRLIPTLPAQLERRSGQRKRIGVVSRFLFRHAVSFCFGGLFASLAQLENCELFLFPIYESQLSDDPVSRHLQDLADSWQPLAMEQPVLAAAQTIQSAQLDLLIYPEIGMDPFSYMLAHSRLALHQVVLAGHPLTSGLSTLDYFITSSELEIPGCQRHYTEQWVGLPGLIQYPRPTPPTAYLTRSQLGLPEDATLYLCPMTLFKIHPDLDACFAEILRRDPRGQIILFEYLNTPYHLILKQRFEQSMPDIHTRILFLPFQSFEGFLRILNQADVVLDTHYFSGGNTSFLAFELGVPVVTLPSEQLKARSTWGLYQRMGLQTGIASDAHDYIEKALLLGQNPDLRQDFSRQILANNSLIFEQTDWNRAFGDWCLQRLNND